MAIKTNIPGQLPIYDDTFVADGDLTGKKNTVVVFSAQSTGKPKIKAPTGQGVFPAGVLLDDEDTVTDGTTGEVRMLGVAKIKAASTFNAGVEVTIAGTGGTIEAAATGDYVVGISREGAAEANQLVAVTLTGTYQKN